MASSSPIPLQISGYFILPLSLPPLPSFNTPATHYLYITNHQPKIPTPTAPRSLFLVNVPFDSTDAHIKHLLSTQLGLPNGRIEDVQFEGDKRKNQVSGEAEPILLNTKNTGKKRKRSIAGKAITDIESITLPSTWDRELHSMGGTAVVVLVDRASTDAVMSAVKRVRKEGGEPKWGDGVEEKLPAFGFARYLNHHKLRYPDKPEILESVNKYMSAFAAQEELQAELRARQRQEPDEEGFVLVTKGGRNGPARQDLVQEQAEKQKEKQKGLEDFYRFQGREKRKERAGELVRKFEEDKERVRRMKERRGNFKPE